MRTEGQRLLCALPGSNATIAAACGSSKPSIGSWKRAEKIPTPAARRALESAYPSVPASSWDLSPGSTKARGCPPAPRGGAELGRDSLPTLPEVEKLLGAVRAAREAPGLLPGEVVKAIAEERALLALKARLERLADQDADDLEDKLVRHPAFKRVVRALLVALRPFPGAVAAAAAAMGEMHGGDQ